MNASDLRINNFVECFRMGGHRELVVITTISKHKDCDDYLLSGSYFPFMTLNQCEPIPLTEEWLLKLGFIKSPLNDTDFETEYLYQLNNPMIILNEERGFFFVDACNKQLEYVHQLQNLYFALTGEELGLKK